MKPECYWTGHLNPSVSQFTTCYTNRNYPFSSRTFLPLLQSFEVGLSWVSRQHEISRWQADTFIKIVTFVWKYLFKKLCAWLLWKKYFQASLSLTCCWSHQNFPENQWCPAGITADAHCWPLLSPQAGSQWPGVQPPLTVGPLLTACMGGLFHTCWGMLGRRAAFLGSHLSDWFPQCSWKPSLLHTTGGTPV